MRVTTSQVTEEAKGSLCLTNHILLPTTLPDGRVIIGSCSATAQARAPCSSNHELCSLRTGDLSHPSSNDPERQGLSLSPFVRMGPREVAQLANHHTAETDLKSWIHSTLPFEQ